MIVINNIKEIEKYKYMTVKAPKEFGYKNFVWYVFKDENGNIDNVVFNVRVPFSFAELYDKQFPKKKRKNYDCAFEEARNMKKPNFDGYAFAARNIEFKKGGGLCLLRARETYIKRDFDAYNIVCQGFLACDTLVTDSLYAGMIDAKSLTVEKDISCKHIKAQEFHLNKNYFFNIDCDMMP